MVPFRSVTEICSLADKEYFAWVGGHLAIYRKHQANIYVSHFFHKYFQE